MTPEARRRTAVAATLPVLAVGLPGLTALALAGLVPWDTAPAVLVAGALRSLVVFHRLGRVPGSAAAR
jgi:hypothetical protein